MKPAQEPKYAAVTVVNGAQLMPSEGQQECRLMNRRSGELIPDDEPVIIFRARDVFAKDVIACYLGMIEAYGCSPDHRAAVRVRFADFVEFANAHPDRMKKPD